MTRLPINCWTANDGRVGNCRPRSSGQRRSPVRHPCRSSCGVMLKYPSPCMWGKRRVSRGAQPEQAVLRSNKKQVLRQGQSESRHRTDRDSRQASCACRHTPTMWKCHPRNPHGTGCSPLSHRRASLEACCLSLWMWLRPPPVWRAIRCTQADSRRVAQPEQAVLRSNKKLVLDGVSWDNVACLTKKFDKLLVPRAHSHGVKVPPLQYGWRRQMLLPSSHAS
jgi:hypothetical protein